MAELENNTEEVEASADKPKADDNEDESPDDTGEEVER